MSSAARQQARHPERHQGNDRVCVGYIHPGVVDGQFCSSLFSMLLYEANHARRLQGHINIESGPRIVEARSQIVHGFLTAPDLQGCDWLLMIDADMTFDADALERLLASAQAQKADAMGGLCFAGGHSGRIYPTIYRLTNEADGHAGVEPVYDYPMDACVKAGATGAAFLLVRRSILERMTVAFGKHPDGTLNVYPWFVEGVGPSGRPFGEDVAFCMRVNALGGSVWVDTAVKVGHMKRQSLTEDLFLRWRDDHVQSVGSSTSTGPADHGAVSPSDGGSSDGAGLTVHPAG